MYEELIQVQGAAARIACGRITVRELALVESAVQRASLLPAATGCDRLASAHGEVFTQLAAAAADSVVAAVLSTGADHLRDLVIGVGPRATGLVIAAHWRLLAHLRAGDADATANEVEDLFRGLHGMRDGDRAARRASQAAA